MTLARGSLPVLAAGLFAATGVAAQTPVVFPAGPVPFSRAVTPGASILFKPDKGTGPWSAVVILPTCAGVNGTLYDWAERLVRGDRLVLVLDSYSPRGVANNCQGADAPVTQQQMADDTASSLVWMRGLPMVKPDRFAVVGFSWGAMAATKMSVGRFQTRTRPPIVGLRAVAAFYPGCGTSASNPSRRALDSYDWGGDVTTPLTLFLGAKDEEAPPRFCTARADLARSRGQPVSYRVYENTTHSFDSRRYTSDFKVQLSGGRGTATYRYNPTSTEAAAAELQAFLATYLD